MQPIITKASVTEVQISRDRSRVVALADLRIEAKTAQDDLDAFELWVVAERAGRQAIVDKKTDYVSQAVQLGVVDIDPNVAVDPNALGV